MQIIVPKCVERDCRRWMWSVDPEVFTLSFYSKNFKSIPAGSRIKKDGRITQHNVPAGMSTD